MLSFLFFAFFRKSGFSIISLLVEFCFFGVFFKPSSRFIRELLLFIAAARNVAIVDLLGYAAVTDDL